MKLDYVIHGNSNFTGMGVHCYNTIKALVRTGRKVGFVPIQPMTHQMVDVVIAECLTNRRFITGQEPAIMIFHAEWMTKFCGKPRMGMAIFETDKIPELELAYYKTLDKILVPSQWGKDILNFNFSETLWECTKIDDEVAGKIIIVPEGYDPELFHVEHSPEFIINRAKQRGYWTFLHVGKWEERKSSAMLVRAFYEACKETDIKAVLKLKCANPFDFNWAAQFEDLRAELRNSSGMVVLVEEGDNINIKDEAMAKMYQDSDFGLYASRGEAWGLPIIEGIACGLPTITTDWTGQSEYLRDYPEELLTKGLWGTKKVANDGMFFKGDRGQWIEPVYDKLVEKIKHVLWNPEEIYLLIRKKCINAVREFTWQEAVKTLEKEINGKS